MLVTSVVRLYTLPVELLHEIQLFALSDTLPLTSLHLYQVYKLASPLHHAKYILFRLNDVEGVSEQYTRVLRYPICSKQVLEAFHRLFTLRRVSWDAEPDKNVHSPNKIPIATTSKCDVPRRLFRNIVPPSKASLWKDDDHPISFLRFLFNTQGIPKCNVNAHSGYALARAVHARFIPLVRLLLEQGASPSFKNSLAIIVAIRQKDLNLVKMLIEREDLESSTTKGKSKRRRLEDRVPPDARMLKVAVQYKVGDVVEYLTQVKGVIPDMQTLQMMR